MATKRGAVPIRGRLLNVVRCLFEGGYLTGCGVYSRLATKRGVVYSRVATKRGAASIRGWLLNVVRCLFEGGY